MEGVCTTRSSRDSFLPRPRAPSYNSNQDELFPRQFSYASTISSRQSSWSSLPPRSIPPTPCRMMSPPGAPYSSNVHSKNHKRQQSGIPRPASGSSRRVISQCLESSQPELAAMEFLGAKRATILDKSSQPPTSWRTPQTKQHLVASSAPYSQRKQDLSGLKQQLQIRHYSTQSLSSPSKIGGPRQPSFPPNVSFTKPATATSLLSPSRNITPRRRLMKPMSPPLPKSQSVGSISCFNSPLPTPSPSKASRPSLQVAGNLAISQVDVVGALLESRMTDEEIDLLNQVQKEAATNQLHLRHSFQPPLDKQRDNTESTTPSTAFTKKADTSAVNVSLRGISTRRLDDQRSSGSSSRPLFLNTALANAYHSDSDLPTPNTIGTAISSGPDDDWEINLKLV